MKNPGMPCVSRVFLFLLTGKYKYIFAISRAAERDETDTFGIGHGRSRKWITREYTAIAGKPGIFRADEQKTWGICQNSAA